MKVAIIQAPLAWEDIDANMAYFSDKLKHIEQGTNLVVLPEMFTSGFTMNPSNCYITMDGPQLEELVGLCMEYNFAITGSVIVKQEGKYYNRLVFIHPSGKVEHYDKRHLFSLAGEQNVYQKGTDRIIVDYMGWRICPLVCYDLRFPAFARNNQKSYDLLLYVASWPDQRIFAWDSLLPARAIENMTYVIGVNRCGLDKDSNVYTGHSQVIDYMGKPLISSLANEQIRYCTLDAAMLKKARDRFGFLNDADCFDFHV